MLQNLIGDLRKKINYLPIKLKATVGHLTFLQSCKVAKNIYPCFFHTLMGVGNYIENSLAVLAITGNLFFSGQSHAQPPHPGRLEQRIQQESIRPNGEPDKYAVLISGETERRHGANISLAYQVLLEQEFQRENIYLLVSPVKENFYYPIDDFARRESIKMVFDHLRERIDEKDLLFVYVTDHGGRFTKTIEKNNEKSKVMLSTVVLPGRNLGQREFARYLEGINSQTGIFLFDQCFSGGFAEEIGKGNYIAIASTQPEDTSKSRFQNSFGGYFMLALRDKAVSDLNADGRVSVEEAFEYAKTRHSGTRNKKQEPFIQGEINAGELFLK